MPEERRPQLHHFESQETRILYISVQVFTANVVSELNYTVQAVYSAYGGNFSCVLLFVCVCVFLFLCASFDLVIGLLTAELTRK